MPYDPDRHHRRSVRLRNYDYAGQGAYFVTVTTHDRDCSMGWVVDGEVVLSDYGRLVQEEWLQTAVLRPYVELDAFVVMPNHIHGIVIITNRRQSVEDCDEVEMASVRDYIVTNPQRWHLDAENPSPATG